MNLRQSNAFPNRYCLPAATSAARPGYTLLELMLALALLGALLTVAWSLMGTYRDAEQKGWQLSMRTQTVRAIHAWLQQDMDHIALPVDDVFSSGLSATTSISPRSDHGFRGTTAGFTVTIQPSLAPLPFLERLMSDPDLESLDPVVLPMVNAALDSPAPPSLWSDEPLHVEYRLIPTASSDTPPIATASSSLTFDNETPYLLSRIARRAIPVDDPAGPSGSSPLFSSANASAADRVLTAQDLYRQTDDQPAQLLGPVLEESVLHGLVNARFRYFDGRSWLDEWNAAAPSLPLAVALSFDMPRSFEPTVTLVPRTTNNPLDDDRGYLDTGLTMADTALASEPIAEIEVDDELSLVENDSHQVQVVVRAQTAANRSSPSLADTTRGVVP